ncbi:hypothetical protein V2J09_015219 [Rumex salicifolius]
MEAYKSWVRQNKDYVHSLESLANGLTWFIPERFSSSEIGLEAVSSIVGIITTINQHIIDTTPRQYHVVSQQLSSFPYSLWISAVKELEILVEVIAEHYRGEDKKWDFIAATEGIKVLLRLAMFQQNGYKMLLHGGEVPNIENEDSSIPQNGRRHFGNPNGLQNPGFISNYHGQNLGNLEGRAMSALSQFGQNARMFYNSTSVPWMQQPLPYMESPERPTLASILSDKGLSGEILSILRPFIYVLFIRKYGRRSWTPWIASLAVDMVGMGFMKHITRSKQSSVKQIHLSSTEKDELKRRKVLWALYVMRDPFFCNYTRKRLESTQKVLENVPVVGMLTERLFELIYGAQNRYGYMSGS